MNKLEECARAIQELRASERNGNDAKLADEGLWPDRNHEPSDEQIARAVIRCLMEPSEAMTERAQTVDVESWDMALQKLTDEDSAKILRAMLQSVLDEAGEK